MFGIWLKRLLYWRAPALLEAGNGTEQAAPEQDNLHPASTNTLYALTAQESLRWKITAEKEGSESFLQFRLLTQGDFAYFLVIFFPQNQELQGSVENKTSYVTAKTRVQSCSISGNRGQKHKQHNVQQFHDY